MVDYESAAQNMAALEAWLADHSSADRNEATTRLQLIDKLLIECLGWPEHMIEAERHFRGEYTDYELGEQFKLLLVEAKREGAAFELPAGFKKRIAKLGTIRSLDHGVAAAVDQAMGYCQKRGIPIALVTNGQQLIAFMASRQDGIAPEEGDALVFASLADMKADFLRLWNTLSLAGVASRRIFSELSSDRTPPPPEKLSARILDYPGYKNRNPVAADLQILGGLFIEDLARVPEVEREFVRETYCESGALSQYALVSREILASRYSHHFEKGARVTATPARTKQGVEPELLDDLLPAAIRQRPILLVGDVGVGKSMFIKHLVYVDAEEELRRAIVLYVDFGSKPALVSHLPAYVAGELSRQLREDYEIDVYQASFVKGVYHGPLVQFRSGIYGELKESAPDEYKRKEIAFLEQLTSSQEDHLRASFLHIVKGQRRQIVIFLDNVDQRTIEFQEDVFLMGQAFAQNWPSTVFLALRPDTFAQSRSSGSLSAYQPRVFTIDPPRVDRVIQKRLDFALIKLRETGRLPSFPRGLQLGSERLEKYMHMLKQAVDGNEELIEFVDNMSNGNIRAALDFVASFVGSAHVDSEKIFRALERDGRYILPRHEFMRAVIYRDNEHFDPDDSPVLNVFDLSSADAREHFLVLLLLALVERSGTVGGTEGFVGVEDVHKQIQPFGFSDRQIGAALERSLSKSLLATPKKVGLEAFSRVRITSAGAYTAKRLVTLFAYVDAMVVDTPITITEFRTKIGEEESIAGRTRRARTFVDYLDTCWNPDLADLLDWPGRSAALKSNIDRVEERIR